MQVCFVNTDFVCRHQPIALGWYSWRRINPSLLSAPDRLHSFNRSGAREKSVFIALMQTGSVLYRRHIFKFSIVYASPNFAWIMSQDTSVHATYEQGNEIFRFNGLLCRTAKIPHDSEDQRETLSRAYCETVTKSAQQQALAFGIPIGIPRCTKKKGLTSFRM